uniref:Uncharacterized protein n=1 Tax=Haptolina brevifila TaxID=156173 RepID=A0A7S2NQ49_9EUKA|mmetsp:Transcript_85694/g.171162  ORF Transcript_85694/g.171162 Transcript_85694/m.171162 type:complete len:218 (+) Transcript_85694:106-759(+)|eukprot:CAMPEP_0174695512 /NCGR_PEP_ID=MMETSP1094-20130205/1866_1 /TAXON_ID=156173 /ORGANISM="Chrysochromulina brevifilum, Strain UTEX LB 985" /LENGTH=217 /DNA_ID=CAMNT_0015892033 /DNA_START=105 /DNA_END=758 /DNA_ORIENTATION=-
MSSGNTTTYRRPSVSIGMGLDGNDYAYLTKTDKDSTGFFITFNVPFKRQDVFNELLSDESQLGVDGKDTGLEAVILKPGRESGKAVSSGCVRQTTYGSPVWGRTITELREIKAPAYIRWSTLMQDGTFFAFVGKADDNPKIQIALKELKKNSGTAVTIKLDFVEVGFNGALCCLSFIAQDLLKASMESNLPKQWIESMTLRGYERADKKSKKNKNRD